MTYLLVLIVGLGIGYWWGVRAQKGDGSNAGNEKMREKKELMKDGVMGLFSQKDEITNNDVEQTLGVSDATATNYLSELEAEGRIIQLGGQEGRAVRYRKNA